MNWILKMVIENPILLTMVSDVPLDSAAAFWATRVENSGESAITAIPQVNKKIRNSSEESGNRKNGEIIQHIQEIDNDIVAILLAPKYSESIPLMIQAGPPDAIMRNDQNGTLR